MQEPFLALTGKHQIKGLGSSLFYKKLTAAPLPKNLPDMTILHQHDQGGHPIYEYLLRIQPIHEHGKQQKA